MTRKAQTVESLMASGARYGAAVQQVQIEEWLVSHDIERTTEELIVEAIAADEVAAHAENDAQDAEVSMVCADGYVITRGMVWREMFRAMTAPRPTSTLPSMYIIGVNASTNMFA